MSNGETLVVRDPKLVVRDPNYFVDIIEDIPSEEPVNNIVTDLDTDILRDIMGVEKFDS